jgi:myosin heavy subunit
MAAQSIENIKERTLQVRELLKSKKVADYGESRFGQETEFDAKGVFAGLDAILKDILALCRSHVQFVKRSSYNERTTILNHLTNIQSYLNQNNLNRVCVELDNLKPLVRNLSIRFTNERLEVFDSQIDTLQRKATDLDEHLKALEEAKEKFYEINESLESVNEELESKKSKFEEEVGNLEELGKSLVEKIEAAEGLATDASEKRDEIEELLSEVKEYSQVIENFNKKIAQRETQLEDQGSITESYNKALTKYKNDYQSILDESHTLIESAKKALEYKTAEGLSAAFSTKLSELEDDWSTKIWAFLAFAFLLGAVFLGLWAVKNSDVTNLLLTRLSLIPVILLGAGFSASQYVKNKNIIEDYAYKSVLAKSLVGFSEQLSNTSERGELHAHFIKSVLAEIHNDPILKSIIVKQQSSMVDKTVITEMKSFIKDKLSALSSDDKPS